MSIACHEWIAFDGAPPATGCTALAIAPARWLLIEPEAAALDALARAAAAGAGTLVEVSGRWQRIPLEDPAPLRCAIALDQVLGERGVASCWIFDCPVILARGPAGIDCWVEASYAASLRAVLANLGGPG